MAVSLSANGFDDYGYYQRVNAVITTCTSYAIERTSSCDGNFGQDSSASSAAAKVDPETAALDYLLGSDE